MKSFPILAFLLGPLVLWASCDRGVGGNSGPGTERMLIVTTQGLTGAAEAYAEYRRSTGFEVVLVTTQALKDAEPSLSLPDAVADRVRSFAEDASENDVTYVMIIGDAVENQPEDVNFVPVMQGRGGFVGDTPYADLDLDGVPDLPIGRIPFREESNVLAYLERVIEYESNYVPGPWNKTFRTFAGEGGFGEDVDEIFEWVATEVFNELSYDFDVSMTYALSSSPFFLPSAEWEAAYAEGYNSGSAGLMYIGHGASTVPESQMVTPPRRGFFGFLSCGDGDFQYSFEPHASVSETVLLMDQGAVVSLGATSWSHPYGNALLAREFGHALMNVREPTYGLVVTTAKYNMVHRIDELRELVDALAEPYLDEPIPDLVDLAIVEYNLFGDPAVPVLLPPGVVDIDPPEADLPCGQEITVTGSASVDADGHQGMRSGEFTLTVEVERGVILGELTPIDEFNPDPAVCKANHATANNKVVVRATGQVTDGWFSVTLIIPPGQPPAKYYLKGFAMDADADAMGSVGVTLDRQTCR